MMKEAIGFLKGAAVAVALVLSGLVHVGCGADVEVSRDVELGTVEQETRAVHYTDNLAFYAGAAKCQGSGQNPAITLSNCDWQFHSQTQSNTHMGALNLWLRALHSYHTENSDVGLVYALNCQFSNCPWPGLLGDNLSAYADLRILEPDALQCSQGNPVCGLSQPKVGGSDVLRGTSARVSTLWMQKMRDLGATDFESATYAYCRIVGLAVGLATNSTTNSCLGALPSTRAQMLARSTWSSADRNDITQIILTRASDLEGAEHGAWFER